MSAPRPLAGIPPRPDPCEHRWSRQRREDSPLSVRACQLCGAIDWADLDGQAAALIERHARSPYPVRCRRPGGNDGDVA
jgi:hypothetical protein